MLFLPNLFNQNMYFCISFLHFCIYIYDCCTMQIKVGFFSIVYIVFGANIIRNNGIVIFAVIIKNKHY